MIGRPAWSTRPFPATTGRPGQRPGRFLCPGAYARRLLSAHTRSYLCYPPTPSRSRSRSRAYAYYLCLRHHLRLRHHVQAPTPGAYYLRLRLLSARTPGAYYLRLCRHAHAPTRSYPRVYAYAYFLRLLNRLRLLSAPTRSRPGAYSVASRRLLDRIHAPTPGAYTVAQSPLLRAWIASRRLGAIASRRRQSRPSSHAAPCGRAGCTVRRHRLHRTAAPAAPPPGTTAGAQLID